MFSFRRHKVGARARRDGLIHYHTKHTALSLSLALSFYRPPLFHHLLSLPLSNMYSMSKSTLKSQKKTLSQMCDIRSNSVEMKSGMLHSI